MSELSLAPQKFFHKKNAFALVGATSSWTDHAYYLFLELEKKGYNVTPMSLDETQVCSLPAFSEFSYVPEIQHVIFATPDEDLALTFLKKMRDTGLNQVWFEEGFSTPQMEEFARLNFFEVVKGVNLLENLRKI